MKKTIMSILLWVASSASAATTYYVATTGNDGAAGTSTGTAFATINKALSVVAASDTVKVAAGSYTENPAVVTAGGVFLNTIHVIGCDASFGATTSRTVTVTGRFTTSLGSSTNGYYRFENIGVTGATSTAWALGNLHYLTFINCAAYSNTGASTDGFNFKDYALFQNCVAYSNGRDGFNGEAGSSNTTIFDGCTAYSNTRDGFRTYNSGSVFVFCLSYSNTGNGFYSPVSPTVCTIAKNCTADGNGTGIKLGGRFTIVSNCIISNNTTGSSGYSSDARDTNASYNVYYNNGTARTNFPTGTGDVSGDPKFVNRAGGNFALMPSSPAKGIGLPAYLDSGAFQRREGTARAACP